MEFTPPVTAAGFVKSTGSATKLGAGKSCWEMLREAPTTFAPVARKRCVMKEPRPPFAPVMKMTLSLMWKESSTAEGLSLTEAQMGKLEKIPKSVARLLLLPTQ